ncbi:RNA_pol_Rpb2_6 domain-containing protein [Trichonephila clavata]|uniref:RNA_pol_Rpb2_6 domain-containing protein n=1 Tax=Trichonephila clavata TaxID=2740835 RepID=A0A8X6KES0_TRICU|nr:RNA_pol_Rpb2_6 domain-containing protein [Trichonephila clavata]
MDSSSAYVRQLTPYHQIVQERVQDGISPHFALRVPHVVVSYMSFLGCTQEDGIVCRQDVNAFDCCRFYTIRIKRKADGLVLFHPVQGDAYETSLVGTVVHFGEIPLQLEPFSIQVRTIPIKYQAIQMHFNKPPFRVIQHYLSAHTLSICLEQDHLASPREINCVVFMAKKECYVS